MKNILACIDGSSLTKSVCDAACWLAKSSSATLSFLHVLEKKNNEQTTNLSGFIGVDSRASLLNELAEIDKERAKKALEVGKNILDLAVNYAESEGVSKVNTIQSHATFIEAIDSIGKNNDLLVLGHHGEHHDDQPHEIGAQLEQAIRSTHYPVLVVLNEFVSPKSILVAFDSSLSSLDLLDWLIAQTHLKSMEIHLIKVSDGISEQLTIAHKKLESHGFNVISKNIKGTAVTQLLVNYQQDYHIDLTFMGAYGHSKLRQFFMGSTTTNMLLNTKTPILFYR